VRRHEEAAYQRLLETPGKAVHATTEELRRLTILWLMQYLKPGENLC